MKLTVNDLKALSNNAEFAQVATDCIVAEGKYKSIKARVDAYVRVIFDQMKGSFPMDKTCGAVSIDDPELIYLADLDSPEVAAYWSALQQAHKDHGFYVPDGYCPALMAESEWITAKRRLVDTASKITSGELPNADDCMQSLETFKRIVKLLEGIAVNGPAGKALEKVFC